MTERRCRVAVLASGRGSNFEAIVEACEREGFPAEVVCLVTDNPEAGALGIAEAHGIETFIVDAGPKKGRLPAEVEDEIASICERCEADLIALAGFMRILKGALLDRFENRILNIHPALLPSFKGLHGVRQALEYGVKVAGCTVHFVDRSIDGGPIILQRAVEVLDDDDEDALAARILEQEHRAYAEAVELFARGKLDVEGRRVRTTGASN